MPRVLKRPQEQSVDPYKAKPLPVDRQVAVYYRQSSDAQVGNISTTLQTVDMVEHLVAQGWTREHIVMIDMDAGISGTKKISERPGMSMLYDLIENNEIGLVAAQDVDRFFRDITQIETNIFIDACRRNSVLVLTPTMIYDFSHPSQGRYHMQMFRDQAQRAADYLEYHIRGRLIRSRHWLSERGMWAGRSILPSFMVDMRERLPNGAKNPNHRKYVRFEPYADVLLRYYQIYREKNGNMLQTWRHIDECGPFFPDVKDLDVPEGFKVTSHLKRRSPFTGGLTPSHDGLRDMFCNVAYIGHWVHKGMIIQWHNHEVIIPEDLFMFAYNRLSSTDFYGDPNPEYIAYRGYVMVDMQEREEETPIYAGLVYSDDISELPHTRTATAWNKTAKNYKYVLGDYADRRNIWYIKAQILDEAVDEMLLDRLQATDIDDDAWQQALSEMEQSERSDLRRIQQSIKEVEKTKENLLTSLSTLSDAEMIERIQSRYIRAKQQSEALKIELHQVAETDTYNQSLQQARPALQKIVSQWQDVPRNERRSLFEAFAKYIKVTRTGRFNKRIEIYWRDGSITEREVQRGSLGSYWEQDEINKLRDMIEANVDQMNILRTFPQYTWRQLQQRYAYHFNNNRWLKSYSGEVKYTLHQKWSDTDEYTAQLIEDRGLSDSCRRCTIKYSRLILMKIL